MHRVKKIALFALPMVAMLVFADPALAYTYGGEGLHGPTNDSLITNTMFALLIFFPVIIVLFSGLQIWGERRRHKKLVALRAARAAEQPKGGW